MAWILINKLIALKRYSINALKNQNPKTLKISKDTKNVKNPSHSSYRPKSSLL